MTDDAAKSEQHHEQCPWHSADPERTRSVCGCPEGWPKHARLVRVSDAAPTRHARHLVKRGGLLFTATPCYGLHAPWWVVRTMSESWPNEADPVPMRDDDEWMPIEEAAQKVSHD